MIIQARCMNCDEVTAEADLSKPCPSKGWLVDGQWLFSLNPCCSGNEQTNSCIYLSIKEEVDDDGELRAEEAMAARMFGYTHATPDDYDESLDDPNYEEMIE